MNDPGKAPAARPTAALRHAAPLLLLIAVGAGVYGQTVFSGFTFYDDQPLLVAHRDYFSDPLNALACFGHDTFSLLGPEARGVFYRPVLIASFVIDAQIGGIRPAVYHATNVLLHLGASCLVFALLLRLGHGRNPSLFLALLFCVHPTLAPAIAWIPGRNDSLLAIFSVTSVLLLQAFLRSRRWALLPLVLLAFGLVLFTKETGGALAAVLAFTAFVERRPGEGLSPRLAALAGGGAAVVGAWALLRRLALGGTPSFLSVWDENAPMLVVYVGKTLFPTQLVVYPHAADFSLLPGLLAIALLGAAAFSLGLRLLGRAGIGPLWYAAFLSPALFSPVETNGFEHRLYVPMIGALLLAAEVRWPLRFRPAVPLRLAAAALVLVTAAAITLRRLPDFTNDVTFWESAVRSSPASDIAWTTLGYRYFESDRLDEAEQAVRTSLQLHADRTRAHVLLGVTLARRNRFPEAEAALRRALAIDPNEAEAWQNLARVQRAQGQLRQAKESAARAADAQRARGESQRR